MSVLTHQHSDTRKPPKGELRTRTVGLKKHTQNRKFECTLCSYRGKKLKNLNKHHKANHDKIDCPICGKTFNTPASLKWHSYAHINLKYICETCQQGFAFESELTVHKAKHRKEPTFPCMANKCNFKFKNTRRVKQTCKGSFRYIVEVRLWNLFLFKPRSKKSYIVPEKPHTKSHSHCIKCGKGFIHLIQLKRHKGNAKCQPQSL